ncbi:hypothetical protein [Chryseobacterium sp. G0162]|uniref:hypothetical protein n=1 Tax=Chryseobacterium sp. G0162 TaxID=2487063 RepID=UPI000F4E68D9|nr:hypothetical protein [Chryseobacterium sp. G0162]
MNKLLYIILIMPFPVLAQVGVNTTSPQNELHVNGSLQVVNEINVGGDAQTAGDSGTAGFALVSNGSGQPPKWKDITETSDAVGTMIVANGQFVVAQEITVQLSADYAGTAATGSTLPSAIGNLSNEILDNENKYTGDASSNSFQVANDGVYEVYLNMQLLTTANTYPTIGIWNNSTNNWVVNVNDLFVANGAQTYTLITTVTLSSSSTYSFRSINTANYTIKHLSAGTTGSGPVSQVTVRRLK